MTNVTAAKIAIALQERICYNGQRAIAAMARCFGEVPEWLNGAVSKTVVDLVSTVGSNPTLSAWISKK